MQIVTSIILGAVLLLIVISLFFAEITGNPKEIFLFGTILGIITTACVASLIGN